MHPLLSLINRTTLLFYFIAFQSLIAQEQTITKKERSVIDIHRLLIGAFGGGSYNIQIGDYKGICHCGPEEKEGFGPITGAVIEYELSNNWSIVTELFYSDRSMELTSRYVNPIPMQVGSQVKLVDANFERRIRFGLTYFNIGLIGKWETGFYQTYLMTGLTCGFTGDHYLKGTEQISYQDNILIPDRIVSSYLISNPKTQYNAVFSLGYDISLFDKFVFSPEASYNYPLTPIVGDQSDWKVVSVQFLIIAKYRL